MDEPIQNQPITPAIPASTVTRSSCSSCGGAATSAIPNQTQVTVIGHVTAAFPSLSVEKEFAQVLGKRDFKGFTDRETMYSILSKPENRYLARRHCFLITPYGDATPKYVLLPEDQNDIKLLVDTLKRPVSTSEFDVVKGRIAGIAPPALCNAQELPILLFSQLYSFEVDAFKKSIPRSEKVKDVFEKAADDLVHRLIRAASNAGGPVRALAYAALSYAGLYQLVADKLSENWSLVHIGLDQRQSSPERADVRLKFVKRDTGFFEMYCFAVNVGGPFEFLEEALHPCFDVSIS